MYYGETISINASGQVAGSYYDTSGSSHGFVYSGGQFTSLDPPGAIDVYTHATSINDRGQVAGYYYSDDSGAHGFVYSEGKYTSLDVPGATATSAISINASGQVAGSYYSFLYGPHEDLFSIQGGFVYSGGNFTFFDSPGGGYGREGTMETISSTSINDSGQVAGSYYDTSGSSHGFVYSGGQFTSLDPPGASSTYVNSINASGQVAGSYYDTSGYYSHGFVYSGGQFTSLNPPGAMETCVNSINVRGQVAGYYTDTSSAHGFVYSEGKYTSFDAPGAMWTYANSINASGQVAGYYRDASGSHGFIATPMTPFSTFNVTRLIIDQNRGALFLWSNLTLGGDNNGIDPVKEAVTLKIANATMTIPAGSFHKNSHPSFFAFAGQVDNVWLEAFIRPSGRNHFRFQALAYGAPLGDTKNPVTMELTIGDDNGTTTANARTH